MKKLVLLSAVMIVIFCSFSFSQDVLFFYGDINATQSNPMTVTLGDTIDIPIYFQALDSTVNGGSYNCPIGINNQYSDHIITELCYFDHTGTIAHWDLASFDNYTEDSEDLQVWHSTISTWDTYTSFGIIETGPPYDNIPFISLVPEIQSHFYVTVTEDIIVLLDTTCLMVAEGWDRFGATPKMSSVEGTINYNTLFDYACFSFTGGQGLAGTVRHVNGDPFWPATVSIDSQGLTTHTNYNGHYAFNGISGTFEVEFSYPGYLTQTRTVNISPSDVRFLDVEMCSFEMEDSTDVLIWAGGLFNDCSWYDTIGVFAGTVFEIPIYYLGTYEDIAIGTLTYPLGINNAYFDWFDTAATTFYPPFSEWDGTWSINLNEDWRTDSLGNTWDSYTIKGMQEGAPPFDSPPIYFEPGSSPIHLFSFYVHVRDDISYSDSVVSDAISVGMDPIMGEGEAGDTTGNIEYEVDKFFPNFRITSGLAYVPGDVGMAAGLWPPRPGHNDVTYLVNYFRGMPLNTPCLLDGFFASGDVNGDCLVIGSDVTYLVGTFRGLNGINYCPDYEPAWPTEDDAPAEMPVGWPYCE